MNKGVQRYVCVHCQLERDVAGGCGCVRPFPVKKFARAMKVIIPSISRAVKRLEKNNKKYLESVAKQMSDDLFASYWADARDSYHFNNPDANLMRKPVTFDTYKRGGFFGRRIGHSSKIDRLLMDVANRHDVEFDVLEAAFKARVQTLPISMMMYARHLDLQSRNRERGWDVVGWLNRR